MFSCLQWHGATQLERSVLNVSKKNRKKRKKANILQLMDSKKPNTSSNPTDNNK